MRRLSVSLQGIVFGVSLLAAPAVIAAESADKFPSKPIRIMGQGAGSTADYLSRYIGQRLTERWGQSVVVDNRAGAGGTLAAEVVAKAAPDGYSLIMGHAGPMVSAVSLYKNLPYDPLKDFAPLTKTATGVTVLVVHPSVPAKNAQELVALAKQKDLSYASAGNGTISHLTGELFKQVAKVKVQHIPYKSAGFALTSILSGETQISFLSPITAHAQLKSGKVRAIAVSSKERFIGAPDIPSATEAGLDGMEAQLWFGLFTTAKTPKPVLVKLHREITGILNTQEVKDAILQRGAVVAPTTPEELHAYVKSELAKWTPIIKAAGIRAD
ncbi:MAG: tripartite tricarboxylate transporter substrate binding protein [Betaproteobacteria bacterium]|jgi:tripartite-type tricarboxylate transporter receptor subunit TctC|nr:tripartite tricarboxylate transporter substrate binding protein [Betaproteobacteria bacterium]